MDLEMDAVQRKTQKHTPTVGRLSKAAFRAAFHAVILNSIDS